MNPRSWRAFRRTREGRISPPQLRPGEAEALYEADLARRCADEQADSARIAAELARYRAESEAGIEPPPPPLETSIDDVYQQF